MSIILPDVLKFAPYSHSKIGMFNTCPRKWYETYVAKSMKRENKPAFEKGGYIHYALQYFPNPTPKQYTFNLATKEMQDEWTDLIRTILSRPKIRALLNNRVNAEFTWILNKDANSGLVLGDNKWKSMIYGVIDHLAQVDVGGKKKLKLIDWKTGKSDGDEFQLKLYALWMMTARPNIDEVLCGFEYIERDEEAEFCYTRADVDNIRDELFTYINNIEIETDFAPRVCKDCTYCHKLIGCEAHNIKVPIRKEK